MAEYRGLDILDYFVVLVKWKKFLFILALTSFILSYIFIYIFIPETYKSTAVVISAEDNSLGAMSSIAKGLKNLPLSSFGMSGGLASDKYDLFNTLIYSRSNLESMVKEFGLKKEYKAELMSQAIKTLKENIETEITEQNAFSISVSAHTPQKSAKMTNYLVQKINNAVIELNVAKSRNNRSFIEGRYNEIKRNLAAAEDSLRFFQQKSGVLAAEDQTKATIEAYSKLESELAVKQIETSVLKQVYGDNSPSVNVAEISANAFKNKIDNLKNNSGESKSSFIMPISSLPANALKYYRYFREVQIQNAMLEFIIPLYEQTKFEEIKNIPVLQIIDNAVPPDKKSFPPRSLFALIIMLIVIILMAIFLLIKELFSKVQNEKLLFIKKELFSFKKSN